MLNSTLLTIDEDSMTVYKLNEKITNEDIWNMHLMQYQEREHL